MSLLMDALRRAEAVSTVTENDHDQPTDRAVTPADPPADPSPLQLEPLNAPPSGASNDATPASEPPQATATPASAVALEPEVIKQKASAAVGVFAARRSSWHNRGLFVLTGLATALGLLATYYLWTTRPPINSTTLLSTTLIDTPARNVGATPSSVVDSGFAIGPDPAEAPITAIKSAPVDTANIFQPEPPPAPDRTAQEPAQEFAAEPRIEIHKTSRRSSMIPPTLQKAYRAYQAQQYQEAEQLYHEVLDGYPSNRDALLGLAAIAVHQGQRQRAYDFYSRLLKYDPGDKAALIGVQGLSDGQYSLEEGSKIKYWLQSDPNNAQLHFALGNQYAASGQWMEAQQAYFDALRLQADSADYAFNLAVSLDHLNLGSQALTYYQRARDLAADGGALFNSEQLEQRIRQLTITPENTP